MDVNLMSYTSSHTKGEFNMGKLVAKAGEEQGINYLLVEQDSGEVQVTVTLKTGVIYNKTCGSMDAAKNWLNKIIRKYTTRYEIE